MSVSKNNPFAHLMPKLNPGSSTEKNVESKKEDLTTPTGSDKQFLTPSAQQLLASSAGAEASESSVNPPTHDDQTEHVGGVGELARIDTSDMSPQDKVEYNKVAKDAKQEAERLLLDSPDAVRRICDAADALIESNPDLVGPPLFELRNYVERLMVTLKQRPEFDSVIIDKDVRNIMKFIRATRGEALLLREVKTVKKATKAAKKETKGIQLDAMQDAFASIMNNMGVK